MKKSQRNALRKLFHFILLAIVLSVVIDFCFPIFSTSESKSSARTSEKDTRRKTETSLKSTNKKDEKKSLRETFADTLESDLKTFQRQQQLLQAPTMSPVALPKVDRLRNRDLMIRMEEVFAHFSIYLLEGTFIYDETGLEQMYDDVFGKNLNDVFVADYMEFIIREFYFVDVLQTGQLHNFDQIYPRLEMTLNIMDQDGGGNISSSSSSSNGSTRRRFILFSMWDLRSKLNSDPDRTGKPRSEVLWKWLDGMRSLLALKRQKKAHQDMVDKHEASGRDLQHQHRWRKYHEHKMSLPDIGMYFAEIRAAQRKSGVASAATSTSSSSSAYLSTLAEDGKRIISVGASFPHLKRHVPMKMSNFFVNPADRTTALSTQKKKRRRSPPPEQGQRTVTELVHGFLDFLDGEFHTDCNECTAHYLEEVAAALFEDHYDSELMAYFIEFMMEAIIQQDPSPESKENTNVFVEGLLKRVADSYEFKLLFATHLLYLLVESLRAYDTLQLVDEEETVDRMKKIKTYLILRKKSAHMQQEDDGSNDDGGNKGDSNDDDSNDDGIDENDVDDESMNFDENDTKEKNDTVVETPRPELMMGNESLRVQKNDIIRMIRRPSSKKKDKKKEKTKNHNVHDKRMEPSETDGLLLDQNE